MLKDIGKELKAHAPFTAFGALVGIVLIVLIPVFLFLAVWLPCCTSDIIFPLLFSKGRNSRMPRQAWRSFESRTCERIEHEDSHS